jgi:Domain of unknown function (DUF222)/HNH endonuclease
MESAEGLGREAAYSLADEINELAAHISAATCRWLALIAEFDRGEGQVQYGFGTCAEWLAWSCGISPATAREQVRVARALEELPKVRRSFARGKVSYSKVRAMSRIATAESEDYLLTLGEHATAAQLERTVRNYRRCTSVSLEDATASHERRYLHCGWDDDCFVNISGRLACEEGAIVMQALEVARETLRAEAHTPKGQSGVSAETETPGATAADALALMAEALLAGQVKQRTGGARTELVVHVDADTLVADGDPGGTCHLEGGAGLHPETARRLGCDAGLVRIIEREGRPLSVGRKRRTVPPALRRALHVRDHGCRFPGCNRTRGIDAHHVEHWAHGGQTKLSNLVQLCRTHHRLLHEGGYSLEPDGKTFTFRDRHGRAIPNVPRTPDGHETRIRAANRTHAPNIGPTTCMPTARGARMDHAMAVAGLLQADGPCAAAGPGRAPP